MGQVYRGFNKTDNIPSYTVSCSIPTKYQRKMTSNEEKKGFSSQTKRFSKQVLNENPGPGVYGSIFSSEVNSPSFSKKGTTGFVAPQLTRRPQRATPGPNAYSLQGPFTNQNDFNIGVSRVFRQPVGVQRDGPKHKTPAPNQYDVGRVNRETFSTAAGTSSFLSKQKRDSYFPVRNVPTPGHYEARNGLISHSSSAILSPFKSKTQRIPPLMDNHVPGPGAYSPHQAPVPPVKKISALKGYYLISAPPVIVPKDPPLPGPGQYDIGKHDQSKHPGPSAVFASRTKRILQNGAGTTPGPGSYNLRALPKHSFFHNDSRVWFPV
ncbi:O(6)-methylguanine-induced apoptosis 2 [Parambassis ranga]|uniref:O(6)-methylguanine-induced apoptosis 2 n=1 Tax=Parambassis ranga TaxID=210632 RepID=A0A6P7HZG1_9TELE|nr:O(6)-methylguanine-induced apoptosis 2 [Parambassis ranga]